MSEHLPQSLWTRTAPPAMPLPPLLGEARAKVAVIGGGYTGLSAALHLAEAGLEVVLLEAAEPGFGASGRNNGQVIPTLSRADPDDLIRRFGEERARPMIELIRDSAALVFELIARHGIACDAVQAGWVQPAHSPGRMALVHRRAAQWSRHDAPVEVLDRAAMSSLIGSDFWHGGWINPTGGHINPLGFARGLAEAAVAAGARLHGRSPVVSLRRDSHGWRAETPQGAVTADRIILATGTYSDELWPGLRRSVVPVRSYQIATEPVSSNLRRSILPGNQALSDTRGDLHFMHYDRDGRLVTGGALLVQIADERRLTALLARRLARIFPQLGPPRFQHVWHGMIGMTEDGLPHLHELAPGVMAWIGCNGRGVALATALGRALALHALSEGRIAPPMPVTALRTVPLHGLARHLARGMLMLYRWRDRREFSG
ncbi:MAG: FAD-binding oxidoreductase [Alphaproteobacteria bacterium]|nr:FAD-binding oxidoreductase [Alphaproteobacteria bacterium]